LKRTTQGILPRSTPNIITNLTAHLDSPLNRLAAENVETKNVETSGFPKNFKLEVMRALFSPSTLRLLGW
jgi:hypothetical protein